MKQIFIVLLIAAAGAGVYFYFSKKQKTSPSSNSKELILGKWAVDSIDVNKAKDTSALLTSLLPRPDSSGQRYLFEFLKNGVMLEGKEKEAGDTAHYEFTDDRNILLWSKSDTMKTKWNIDRLDSTTLILKDQDSISFYFLRIKE